MIMQSVIYDGELRIARTKWGQFIRGRRQEKEELVVRELLKIPGFHIAMVVARYKGPHALRALRISGKIYECHQLIWVELPECVKYKLRADHDFELAPPGQSVGSLKAKQRRIDEAKRRATRIADHAKKVAVVVGHPAVQEETKEKVVEESAPVRVQLKKTNWPKPIIRVLGIAGIEYTDQVPSEEKKLLAIKGIGFKSMKFIKERLEK